MTEQEREDKLNDALDALIADGEQKNTGDPELNDLVRMAASLRGMPDPQLKDRLRDELLRPPAQRAWLGDLRDWFTRGAGTGRGRIVLVASAFGAGVAVVLVSLFLAGVFSTSSEQAHVQAPIDTTFEMSATKADAIGVDPETEFVLASAEDLPVDTVRALLHVDPVVD